MFVAWWDGADDGTIGLKDGALVDAKKVVWPSAAVPSRLLHVRFDGEIEIGGFSKTLGWVMPKEGGVSVVIKHCLASK